MDRRDDEDYEVLDLGPPSRVAEPEPEVALPPLELGDDDRPAPGSTARWQWWSAVVAVLVVGAITGAYIAHARTDAAALAAEEDEIVLVAGTVDGSFEPSRDVHRLTVSLLNAGSRDVQVLSVHPRGWEVPDDGPREAATTVPAGEWASVAMRVQPSCAGPPPTELDVDVRSEAGTTAVRIPLPPARGLLEALSVSRCAEHAEEVQLVLDRVVDFAEQEPGVRRMALRMWAWWESAEVVGAATSAPGFRAAGVGLPAAAAPNGRVNLELEWRVDDCADTSSLEHARVDLEVVTAAGTTTIAAPLPHRALAMLARFAEQECGS